MPNTYELIGRRIVEILSTAQFGKPGKKRNCPQGLSCGGTCIDRRKVCRVDLTPKQVQIVNSLRQLARLGSKVAEQRLEFIKQGQLKKQRLRELAATRQMQKRMNQVLLDKAQEQGLAAAKIAQDILDKAPGQLSTADYDKADAKLRNELIDHFGEQRGQREWDLLRLKYNRSLSDLVGGKPPDPYDFDPDDFDEGVLEESAPRQKMFNFLDKVFLDAVEGSKYAIESRRAIEAREAELEKITQDVLNKYKPL